MRYATYEWNADDVVSRWRAGTLWKFLAGLHVNDVLAGFDDAQITKYSSPRGAAEFNAFIAQAAAHRVRVELLLGDPSWIPPSGIPSLEGILRKLHAVHFAGLNLDLEPNELRGVPWNTRLKYLAASMKAYVAASPWRVTLDLNYYFVNDLAPRAAYCLMCGLQAAGLKHVDLMTYVGNPKTVESFVQPVLRRYPWMAFTIGQSVEPPSVLPPGDSYWGDGFTEFYADMNELDAKLRSQSNYDGLVIESMQYLETMPAARYSSPSK